MTNYKEISELLVDLVDDELSSVLDQTAAFDSDIETVLIQRVESLSPLSRGALTRCWPEPQYHSYACRLHHGESRRGTCHGWVA